MIEISRMLGEADKRYIKEHFQAPDQPVAQPRVEVKIARLEGPSNPIVDDLVRVGILGVARAVRVGNRINQILASRLRRKSGIKNF